MTTFALIIWFGGIGAAYVAHRRAGENIILSGMAAVIWPQGLGRALAQRFYTDSTIEGRHGGIGK